MRDRFFAHLDALGVADPEDHLLVALSGGCDSVALLHLLRFGAPERELRLSAAHFDHAMRSGSAADACWVAGLCRAWRISLVSERAAEPLRSEEEARRARYAFLRRAAREVGATHLLTAHHADDQAETVLFRILRGTGIEGLAGIPPTDPSGLVRPLLPFWRAEIEAYAEAQGLRWREDPTNLSLDPRRNRLRRELLPWIEERVAPGARRHLVQLAELAREAVTEWSELVAPMEETAVVRREGEALVLARSAFRGYGPALGSRMLRHALRALGTTPDRAGTRAALQFITGASSGRELWLPGGIRLLAEFGSVRVERPGTAPPDQPLEISAFEEAAEGAGSLRIGGVVYRVHWRIAPWSGTDAVEAREWRVALGLDGLRFPLRLRGWEAGDRIRLPGGTKTLKKLFLERRIPRSRRHVLPLLVDVRGPVLWVAGVARSLDAAPQPEREALFLAIVDE